jgi:hypothetical protein
MHVAQVIRGRLTGGASLLAGLVAVGCFSPELGSCLRCDGAGSCPSGQSCQEGSCVKPGQSPAECRDALAMGRDGGSGDDPLVAPGTCAGPGGLGLGAPDLQQVCAGRELDIEVRVQGGEPPYRWSLTTPAEGLTIVQDGSSPVAHLRGVLAEIGPLRLEVAVDSPGCAPAKVAFELEVRDTPRIVTEPPVPCVGQSDYLAKLEAAGGDSASYEWGVSGLPAGLALEGGEIYSVGESPVVLREPVELTLSLSDGACGPVEQKVTWPANLDRECFTIQPPELAALCAGVEYLAQLTTSSSDPEQRWELVDELPAGLAFDTSTGTLSGVPEAAGQLHVRLTGSGGRVADRRYDLPVRESCRFAYIAGNDDRLHLRDVFLSSGNDVVLPETLAAGEAVFDFQFSPDGEWLAFRAGVADRLRVYLVPAGAATPSATAIELTCPGVNDVCGVIDYAWSPSSRALALAVRGDIAGAQDYLTGIDVDAPGAPWVLLGQDGFAQLPLVYSGELSWVGARDLALITADPFSPGQQVPFLATLSETSRTFSAGASDPGVSGGQLGLLPAPGGFVTFRGARDGMAFTGLGPAQGSPIIIGADQRGPWLAPSRAWLARVTADERLQLVGLDGSVLDQTEESVCGTVVAWSPQAAGRERIVCSAVDTDGSAVSEDLTVIDYSSEGRRLAQALIPEVELGVLAGTRRALSLSGNGFAFVTGDKLVLTDASQPQPITSELSVPLGGIVDLQYVGDSRLILQSGNQLWLMNTARPPIRRDLAGSLELPGSALSAVACQEDYALAPLRWCGAASTPGAFLSSDDNNAILFEDDSAGLWITDVQAYGAARQVTTDLAPCSGTVRAAWTKPCHRSYAFQP